MPDPAIDAINAGQPYTEPASHSSFFGRKKPNAKVTFVPNPYDPSAPPRKVVDVDGGGGGLFSRKWGGRGVVWGEQPPPKPYPIGHRPMPQPQPTSSHSAAQGLSSTSALNPSLPSNHLAYPHTDSAGHTHPHLLMQPLPDDFWQLSWRQRRHLEKMRAREEKSVRDWEKAQREWERAERVGREKREKEEIKRKKAELKAQEKLLKKNLKNPYRAMPTPTPATSAPTPVPATQSQPNPPNTKWMLTPTMEEFGVRRPFDHVGSMPMPGQGDWPMMSRTMTHAMIDMSREERVHAVSAGTVFGGGWGGHW